MKGSNPSSGPARGFANCTRVEYQRRLDNGELSCVFNYPDKFLTSSCGNGLVESPEECDCGSERECNATGGHRCCNFDTCTLKSGAQCAQGDCCQVC